MARTATVIEGRKEWSADAPYRCNTCGFYFPFEGMRKGKPSCDPTMCAGCNRKHSKKYQDANYGGVRTLEFTPNELRGLYPLGYSEPIPGICIHCRSQVEKAWNRAEEQPMDIHWHPNSHWCIECYLRNERISRSFRLSSTDATGYILAGMAI